MVIKTAQAHKQGSVLLLTLLVVSLLMILVLSFTVYVRLELRTVANRMDLVHAQQNAKLSMHLALARLQETAGEDQRVTASAGILGNGSVQPNARHWTGVWERNPAGGVFGNPDWLVSGSAGNPLSGAGANALDIFPATLQDPAVQVPLVDLIENGTRKGQWAYWVSQSADKVAMGARRGAIALNEHPSLKPTRALREYQMDFGPDLDHYFSSGDLSLTDSDLGKEFEKLSKLRDLPLFSDSAGNPLNPATGTLHDLSHDLTLRSLGVLENPVDGGLKKNLSDLSFRDSFLATDETSRFLAPKGGRLQAESGLPDSSILPGDPYFSPRPLLTEVVLYMGIFHTNSDAKIRIRYHLEAEFLNPYSLPLEFAADNSSTRDRAVVLLFENMPTITIEDTTPGSTAPTLTQDLNELSAYSPTDTRRYINSWMEISADGTPNIPILHPGEIYQVREPNPVTQARGLARDFGTTRWSNNAGTRPDDNAQIRISATHPSEGITLKMVSFSGSGNPRDKEPVMEFRGLKFDDFEIYKTFNSGQSPFSRASSSTYTLEDEDAGTVNYIIAYHFRLLSDTSDREAAANVLSGHDFRDPEFDADDDFVDLNGDTVKKATLLDPSYSDPSYIALDPTMFSQLDLFSDITARDHRPDFIPGVWFDIPDQPLFSVGQLSHLHLYNESPQRIGSPLGGDYNAAFDRYFFSPKIPNPLGGGSVLAHPALQPLSPPDAVPNAEDASRELVNGQFNINSTSPAAWEAVLSSPVFTPAALDETTTANKTRPAAFFRLPQFQARHGDFMVTETELANPVNAFAQGIRSLHGSTGKTQLKEVANEIVSQLEQRAEPFADLQSFLNAGILQNAIDSQIAINDGLFAFSNVELSQQDLIRKIAPYAAPRSDTFTIRAYGSLTTANGELKSAAVCEAVVQRLPEKLDGSDPHSPTTNLLDARRFEIISFRWLTEDEI